MIASSSNRVLCSGCPVSSPFRDQVIGEREARMKTQAVPAAAEANQYPTNTFTRTSGAIARLLLCPVLRTQIIDGIDQNGDETLFYAVYDWASSGTDLARQDERRRGHAASCRMDSVRDEPARDPGLGLWLHYIAAVRGSDLRRFVRMVCMQPIGISAHARTH
jgi:hypothetical protein